VLGEVHESQSCPSGLRDYTSTPVLSAIGVLNSHVAGDIAFVRILVHSKQKGFALEIAVISNCVDGDLVCSVPQRGREIEP
jgi:hypothetical protein